ncbi:MAG TPA: hypothetical protein VHQ45_19485 [Gemmatimonadaceae bacterium]|nr:hypothetical protein [Gemmatimonadaceae bacterium]
MRHLVRATALTLFSLLLAACTDTSGPTAPADDAAALARRNGGADDLERRVNMMDACDPTTFNAALGDPAACVRNGGVTFEHFIAQLTKHQKVGAWHFAPPNMHVAVGDVLLAVNRGGEDHTFTEVEEFGGGIVPDLNALAGTPVQAPECLSLDEDDFVPPGGTYRDEVEEAGTELYQCCIHPWMRTVVHARAHDR